MCQVRKKPQALEISASLQAGEKDEAATPKCGHKQLCGLRGFSAHNAQTKESINNCCRGNILPLLV